MIAKNVACVALVVLQTLMGLAALGGGAGLILTDGLGMPAEWLEGSPFASYTIPGLVLLMVGGVNLVGAATVLRRHRWGAPMSLAGGVMWMGWFVVQVAVVGLINWQQPAYCAVGLLIIALAMPTLTGWFRAPPSNRSGAKKLGRRQQR